MSCLPLPKTVWWVFLPAAALVGCGGPFDAKVSGIVTLDGNPLPRGTITFKPQSPGPVAYGLVEGDGKYTLRTGREEGLVSGQYVATVLATEASAARGKDGGPPPMGKPITPAWYADQAHSGLTYTVAKGKQEINIELRSTPPAGWKPPKGRK